MPTFIDSVYKQEWDRNSWTEGLPVDVMLIANVSKEPNLTFWGEHGNAERVDWGIPKPLVEEPSSFIQPAEVFLIGFAAEVVEIPDFKVREKLAIIVVSAVVWIEKPVEIGIGVDQFGMRVDE